MKASEFRCCSPDTCRKALKDECRATASIVRTIILGARHLAETGRPTEGSTKHLRQFHPSQAAHSSGVPNKIAGVKRCADGRKTRRRARYFVTVFFMPPLSLRIMALCGAGKSVSSLCTENKHPRSIPVMRTLPNTVAQRQQSTLDRQKFDKLGNIKIRVTKERKKKNMNRVAMTSTKTRKPTCVYL